jgi:hypothetical protein
MSHAQSRIGCLRGWPARSLSGSEPPQAKPPSMRCATGEGLTGQMYCQTRSCFQFPSTSRTVQTRPRSSAQVACSSGRSTQISFRRCSAGASCVKNAYVSPSASYSIPIRQFSASHFSLEGKCGAMLKAVLHACMIGLLEAFLGPPVKLVQWGRVR